MLKGAGLISWHYYFFLILLAAFLITHFFKSTFEAVVVEDLSAEKLSIELEEACWLPPGRSEFNTGELMGVCVSDSNWKIGGEGAGEAVRLTAGAGLAVFPPNAKADEPSLKVGCCMFEVNGLGWLD